LIIALWSTSIPNVLLTDFRIETGKIIFEKPYNRIQFDLFSFPKGLDCGYTLTWKANSRTQHGRLAYILSDQTMFVHRIMDRFPNQTKTNSDYFVINIFILLK
jgi:hypothetical protein